MTTQRSIYLAGLIFVGVLSCRLVAPQMPEEPQSPPTPELPTRTPQPVAPAQTQLSAAPSPVSIGTNPVGQSPPGATIWKPTPGTTWQWQLSDDPLELPPNVQMIDMDLFDRDASQVATLHEQGKKVICYMSVGSWEDWRPDAASFPPEVIGKEYSGWEGEKWLDIRRIDLLSPILLARLDLCREKGFDGVEPDNIDGYTNRTGFPLAYQDQIRFNIWLAQEAHARGLSIGLKNDGDQADDLLSYFDWAMTEDCFAQEWCEEVLPFIRAGKAVFAAEYTDTGIQLEEFCPQAQQWGFSVILKNRDLDGWIKTCP